VRCRSVAIDEIEVTVAVIVKKLIVIPRQAITTAHHGLRW
jgi:hypothetical protein